MISDLIYKELIEEITPEESRVLKKWLEEPANRALYDRIRQKNGLGRRLYEYVDVDSLKDFRSTLPAPAPAAPRRSLRYALYAAALVPLLLTGCMLLMGVKDQMHKIDRSTLPEWVLLVVWSTGCILTLLIAPGWRPTRGVPSFWPRRTPSSTPATGNARFPTKKPKRRQPRFRRRLWRRLRPCIRWSCRAV